MTVRLAPTPVQPIGRRTAPAFVCPGGLRMVERDEFPPTPNGEALRELRLAVDLTLRAAAKLLELSAVQLSELERGRSTLDDAGWLEVFRRLARHHRATQIAKRTP